MRLVCLLLVVTSASAARGGEPAPPSLSPSSSPSGDSAQRAREHFAHGRELYLHGKFDDASGEFELGYRAQPEPLFLYNIAQSARRAGRVDKAIDFYQRYLGASPDAPERAEVRRYLDELARGRALTTPPERARVEPERPSRRGLWIGLGVGAAALVVAGVATGLALGLPRGAPSSELGNYRVFAP